ncbi:MAG: hypothetical protein KAJ43_04200, partial [Gemmatimonadetes bacterium]|nr:hypothetical protein [Gemmatimonadota bacterium]
DGTSGTPCPALMKCPSLMIYTQAGELIGHQREAKGATELSAACRIFEYSRETYTPSQEVLR